MNLVQFSAAAVSGSFGGLLAAAIAKMDGIGGMRSWAWIFVSSAVCPYECSSADASGLDT